MKYVDILSEATIRSGKSVEHLFSFHSIVQKEVESEQCSFNNSSRDEFSDRADLQDPVSTDFLGGLRDVASFQIFYTHFIDSFLGVLRKA